MKAKNYLLMLVLMVNASAYGMYGRKTEPQYAEEFRRDQKEKIQAQRFAKIERYMNAIEVYYAAKTKKLEEAQKQKESIGAQSPSKVIYKHQDQQAKL